MDFNMIQEQATNVQFPPDTHLKKIKENTDTQQPRFRCIKKSFVLQSHVII